MKDEQANKLAWKIYQKLLDAGCVIGNASVPIIEREIDEFCNALIEQAARIAEMPISNGHSSEARENAEHGLHIARTIRTLKGWEYIPARRLK